MEKRHKYMDGYLSRDLLYIKKSIRYDMQNLVHIT